MIETWRVLPRTQDELDAMLRERESSTYLAAADMIENHEFLDECKPPGGCNHDDENPTSCLAAALRAKAH